MQFLRRHLTFTKQQRSESPAPGIKVFPDVSPLPTALTVFRRLYPSEVQQLIWDDFMTRYFSGTVAELQTAKPIFSSQCKVLFKQAFHRLIKDVAEEKGDDVQNWKMLQKKKVMASSIGRRTQRKIGC
ncbi:hypothetical protein O6P43_032966 [Quillaja saponaria]|uniref:Uncharacterized protein n=1 Tax=Quillaja saponaria TaxID=32244 RepID=A0AAD7KPT7_QUISA|nr:hypothetical protein O6P43_032966 [Quillaja saponaria]